MRLNRFSVVPVLICLLAFAVRVWHLPNPQFNGDEGFTYLLASLSYGDLARKIIEIGEPQPIGSFFLEKFWLDMGGGSEFNLRLLNVCFGVLAVAMMWRLFHRRDCRRVNSGIQSIWATSQSRISYVCDGFGALAGVYVGIAGLCATATLAASTFSRGGAVGQQFRPIMLRGLCWLH